MIFLKWFSSVYLHRRVSRTNKGKYFKLILEEKNIELEKKIFLKKYL